MLYFLKLLGQINLGQLMLQSNDFENYYHEIGEGCLEKCCNDCKSKPTPKCHWNIDHNLNPYHCLPEAEANVWEKTCMEHDENLCQHEGTFSKVSPV